MSILEYHLLKISGTTHTLINSRLQAGNQSQNQPAKNGNNEAHLIEATPLMELKKNDVVANGGSPGNGANLIEGNGHQWIISTKLSRSFWMDYWKLKSKKKDNLLVATGKIDEKYCFVNVYKQTKLSGSDIMLRVVEIQLKNIFVATGGI